MTVGDRLDPRRTGSRRVPPSPLIERPWTERRRSNPEPIPVPTCQLQPCRRSSHRRAGRVCSRCCSCDAGPRCRHACCRKHRSSRWVRPFRCGDYHRPWGRSPWSCCGRSWWCCPRRGCGENFPHALDPTTTPTSSADAVSLKCPTSTVYRQWQRRPPSVRLGSRRSARCGPRGHRLDADNRSS